MKTPKVILAGVLAGPYFGTAAQAADYRDEPYAEVETHRHSQVFEVPQERPLPPRFHDGRTYRGARLLRRSGSMTALCLAGALAPFSRGSSVAGRGQRLPRDHQTTGEPMG